jgi:hypothetical protein
VGRAPLAEPEEGGEDDEGEDAAGLGLAPLEDKHPGDRGL